MASKKERRNKENKTGENRLFVCDSMYVRIKGELKM